MTFDELKEKAHSLPLKPGVYILSLIHIYTQDARQGPNPAGGMGGDGLVTLDDHDGAGPAAVPVELKGGHVDAFPGQNPGDLTDAAGLVGVAVSYTHLSAGFIVWIVWANIPELKQRGAKKTGCPEWDSPAAV